MPTFPSPIHAPVTRSYSIIDSHCHYWEGHRPDRPWDEQGWNAGPPLSVEKLLQDAAGAGVAKVVQVTPSIMGYDNRYAIEGAQRYPDRILGVFGRFDPTGGTVGERLAKYREQPKILGLRLTLNKPPWSDWLADGTLNDLWREAGRLAVPIAVTAADQGAVIREIARRHSTTRILVDHMGVHHNKYRVQTGRRDSAPFAHWASVLALADTPNVWIKISCIPEASNEPYPFRDMHRFLQDLYQRFGSDRLIWGSDYPPSSAACSYKQSVDFMEAVTFLDESDKAKILGGNLLKAVGLG